MSKYNNKNKLPNRADLFHKVELSDKVDLEKIYERLDHISGFVEKSFDEIEDIGEIRSIVDDLRANLLKTIEERVEYILGKQRDIYELRFSQIENRISYLTETSKEEIKELKDQFLSEINKIKIDLIKNISTNEYKIDSHLKDKINWKQIVAPSVTTGLISILLVIIIAIIDSYFKLGIYSLISKLK